MPGCRSYVFYTREISTVLEVLNSSSNFFIYTALRKQFRVILRKSLYSSCCAPSGPKGFEPVSMANTNGKVNEEEAEIENTATETTC